MKRSLNIFLHDQMFRICPYGKTTEGMPKLELFVIFIEKESSATDLGKQALAALNRPLRIIQHPKTREEWFAIDKEWYKTMKIKSWRSFIKNAKSVLVDVEDNNIEVLPTNKTLPSGFLKDLPEKARFCSADDPEALGQAIIDAFADCE